METNHNSDISNTTTTMDTVKNSEAPNQDDNSDSGIISSIGEPSVDPPTGRPEANTDTKLNAKSNKVGDEDEAHSNATNDTTDDNIVGGSGGGGGGGGAVEVEVGVDDVAFTSMSSPVQELEESEINNSFSVRGELYFNPSAR